MVEVPRDQPQTFGQFIKQAREANQLGLRATARKACIAGSFLSDIENSNRMPSPEVIKRLAAALEISERELERLDPRKDLKTLHRVLEAHPEIAGLLRRFAVRYQEGEISYDQLTQIAMRGG